MKLMTYNILSGGKDRLPLIIKAINEVKPDYLTINEANTFASNDNQVLKEVAKTINLPYYEIALSGEYNYHVTSFSKYPFKKVIKLQPLMRACVVGLIETELGEISIASLHLTPYSEDLRHPEIDLILGYQKQYENRILMGDMNSLSPDDAYDQNMVKHFNEMQMKKFTKEGKLRFDAISKILSSGYTDTAVKLGKNKDYTAPTTINEYEAHSDMRLDYIFMSESLVLYLTSYSVIKNETTNKASDHYPVVVELK